MSNQMKGIDVSKYQGNINWAKVKAAGIEFVIIRAGYGKSTVDSKFVRNIEGAIAEGLHVGVYWFIYGISELDMFRNAKKFHETIAPYKDQIDMKVWCDFEYDTDRYANKQGKTFTKAERTALVEYFCKYMSDYGYDVGVYANPDYLKNKFNDLSEYPLWLAYYSSSKGSYNPFMWQHTSKGAVAGISGNVDMNICYEAIGEDAEPVNPYPVPTRTLKRTYPTMKGDDVKWLQTELSAYNLSVDGSFGGKTLAAVKDYQLRHGLDVDGKVGPATRKALLTD